MPRDSAPFLVVLKPDSVRPSSIQTDVPSVGERSAFLISNRNWISNRNFCEGLEFKRAFFIRGTRSVECDERG